MKTESFDYILFAGHTKNDLQPIASFAEQEHAIEAGKCAAQNGFSCVEVTFMPEDDDDTNEVVWSNCGRA